MRTNSLHPTLVNLVALLATLALLASACGGGDDDNSGPSETDDSAGDDSDGDDTGDDDAGTAVTPTVAPVPEEDVDPDAIVTGGTLRVALEAESDGLNPVANNFAQSAYMVGFALMEPLAYYDEAGNWFPWLAESFTRVEGTNSWQIKLREGILFHDGSELDADDLVAGFEAQLADPVISLAVGPSYPAENAVEKLDTYTVQFNLIRPSAHFPTAVTAQLGMVVSSEYIAAAAADASLNQSPVGTGPFRLVSRTQDDVTIVERNPDYWRGADTVHLDRVEFHVHTDTAVAADLVAAGDLDVVISSNADAILTMREADGVVTIENLLGAENDIMLNTRAVPFDDIRARQALTFSADRESYAALISQGTSPLADSMFHPDLIWNNPAVVQEGNQPELAQPLVDAYCADLAENCSDGKINMELQYSGPSVLQTRIADLLSAGWEPFFNITIEELPQDQHIVDVITGAYNVVTWRQFGAVDPVTEVIWLECATAEGFLTINWVRVCDEDRDALLFEQRATADLDRRVEIWHEIQQSIHDTYSYIFMTHANWTMGLSESVRNICGQEGPDGVVLFCNNGGVTFLHGVWLSE